MNAPVWKIGISALVFSADFASSQPVNGGWLFNWSDEFNGPTVDAATWGYETGYVRNNEAQYYSNRLENSRIDNGTLLIQALRDNWNGNQYTSASRTTRTRKSFQYGRFEMRAQIDIQMGSWPAWWWLPNSGGWPRGGEIDMMEFYRGMALFNVMDGNQVWSSPTVQVSTLGGARWAAEFHTWTMEWDSTKIDLYLDGVLMNHYLLSRADGTGPNGTNPFRHPGYMILNQALGGTQGGSLANTTFPVNFRVDWVRVHTWSNSASYTLTVNGGTGDGPYVPGTAASITANMPAVGQVFDRWVVNAGGASVDFPTAAAASLVMPTGNVTVTATYRSAVKISAGSGVKSKATKGNLFDIRGINRSNLEKAGPRPLFLNTGAFILAPVN